MAGFGGSVKLTGADEYKNALKDITQNLKLVSAEMKATSSGFEAGEKSEKEMIASSKQLKAALDEQKAALANLKNQLPNLIADYEKAGRKHKELSSELAIEKKTLEEVEKEFGKSSEEYKKQEKVVEDLKKEVASSGKEYERLGKDVDSAQLQIAKSETTINETAIALDKMGKSAEESGEEAVKGSDGFTVMKGVLSNLATQAINACLDGLKQLGSAFIDIGKEALNSYAEFEQLEGGVQKLFGEDTAKIVADNAQAAFSSAGMSANEYMETVTGFSASLIAGLGGDTAKAAEVADVAVRDMADNANTFGTSIESIQNAYQGFAKGNFQLLDNLKLGYGGTSAEMLRLVQDAGVVDKSVKSINDVSFDQMIEAIHIVQENMNITGTTAKEASGTIEGSTASMKAAWQNLLTGMASENADFETLASNFIGTLVSPDGKGGVIGTIVPRITQVIQGLSETISTTLPGLMEQIMPIIEENLPSILESLGSMAITVIQTVVQTLMTELPTIAATGWDLLNSLIDGIIGALPDLETNVPEIINSIVTTLAKGFEKILTTGSDILKKIVDGIKKAIPVLTKMLPQIITTTASTLVALLPTIVKTGTEILTSLINGIVEAIPELVKMLPEIITTIVDTLTENLPLIIDAGIEIITSLVKGIVDALPELAKEVPEIIKTIVKTIGENLPKIVEAGLDIVKKLAKGIGDNLGTIGDAIGKLWDKIKEGLNSGLDSVAEVGKNIIDGLWKGIDGARDWIVKKVKELAKSILDGMKKALGISSPSKAFMEVGSFTAQGFGIGFEREMSKVTSQMQKSIPMDFDTNINVTRNGAAGVGFSLDMVNAFKEALYQVKIEMNDEQMGRFVDKTVSNLVFN